MSSFLIAAPEALAAASEDLTGIGEAIRAARASAASATTVIAPAAADEVSAAVTRLLGDYAADFQALSARTATFHDGFVQTLLHSASAFAGTEAANGSSLQTLKQDLLGLINAPSYALIGRPLIGPGAPSTPATPMSQNLLVNPGFEVADPSVSGYSGVTIPGWTVTGTPTVIPYGTPRAILPFAIRLRSRTCRSSWAFHNTRPRAAATISPAADPWPRPPSAKPSTSPARPERRTR